MGGIEGSTDVLSRFILSSTALVDGSAVSTISVVPSLYCLIKFQIGKSIAAYDSQKTSSNVVYQPESMPNQLCLEEGDTMPHGHSGPNPKSEYTISV